MDLSSVHIPKIQPEFNCTIPMVTRNCIPNIYSKYQIDVTTNLYFNFFN